ncbi:TetR/AcrR family transcriptional regulator [Arthrobacter sulfonylureivorans]|jgi:AcrR family transcriptional regulator|uniref:TetR/AcrR family transcriptional regulator n=1 Tax=Arthrobacter sulfonylureivorans TaxID=2486855 RepID=A0ABY3WA79_9MICC|nr:TetR/AcrR family transcriptional regulator [Arthrobacter sulfonylureivorans]UNK47249.1 TetR/AcrR family transcriptional regulator [Arthrobacter sulfonylureivorans]
MSAAEQEHTTMDRAPGQGTVPELPEPLPLRKRQQLRTRQDLVRATIDIIDAAGAKTATIDRITVRAGTSRATLYAHFPGGRTDLMSEAYRTIGQDLIDAAERDAAGQDDWIEKLCAYPRAMLDLAARRELSLFYNVSGPQHFGIGRRRGSASKHTLDTFVRELRNEQDKGGLRAELDIEAIAGLLIGAIREAGIDASRDPGTAPRNLSAFRQLLEALAGR